MKTWLRRWVSDLRLGRWHSGLTVAFPATVLAIVLAVVLVVSGSGMRQTGTQANALAASTPQAVVTQFYQWYLQNQPNERRRIDQQRSAFEPDFYQQLVLAFQKQPQDGSFLDFDPFSDSQVNAYRMVVRSTRRSSYSNQEAEVDIDVYAGLRPPGTPVPIKVLVQQQSNRWQISNFVYMRSWNNLLCYLREING